MGRSGCLLLQSSHVSLRPAPPAPAGSLSFLSRRPILSPALTTLLLSGHEPSFTSQGASCPLRVTTATFKKLAQVRTCSKVSPTVSSFCSHNSSEKRVQLLFPFYRQGIRGPRGNLPASGTAGIQGPQPRRFSTVSAWLSSPDRRPLVSSWAPGPGVTTPAQPCHDAHRSLQVPNAAPPRGRGYLRPLSSAALRWASDRQGEAGLRFPTAPPAGQSERSPGAPGSGPAHRPRNPLGLQRPFLPASSKHFPICDLPGQGPASGVWEGSAFLSPLYRDRRGEPQRAVADPEKSSFLQPSQLQMNRLKPRGEQACPNDTWARTLGS